MVASLHEIVAVYQHDFAHSPFVVRWAIEGAISHGLLANTHKHKCVNVSTQPTFVRTKEE